ncbi:plasmid mobilization protein [Puia sp. P3]|uniref:plasmid mobilization protein n=1 Tax=Puia sp. P3 TaxID=3423952 RepID=UPI003D665377
MKDQSNRSRLVGLRFTRDEFEKLDGWRRQSTTPELSEFIRRALFHKPITFHQRNQSLDDFMAEMMRLRTELNAVGNNFNQAVKKLHTLSRLSEFQDWLSRYDQDRQSLLQLMDSIKTRINEIADQWLQ